MLSNPLDYYSNDEWEAFMQEAKKLPTPCVICKLSIMKREYMEMKRLYPHADIYYAVKSNPGLPGLKMLKELGSCFDIASRGELDMVLGLGVEPSRLSFGNTIKKSEDIAYAYSKGVRKFATDSEQDLMKLTEHAPGSDVFVRILLPGSPTADWPLSRKFGCSPSMAADLIKLAKSKGLNPIGISFHVGSQQRDVNSWDSAMKTAAGVFSVVEQFGEGKDKIHLTLINTGGGLPGKYIVPTPEKEIYAEEINKAIVKYFGDGTKPREDMKFIMEPGRSLAANCGILVSQVVMCTKKERDSQDRWLYLDCGVFGGLYETIGECLKYPLYLEKKDGSVVSLGDDAVPTIIAGPTCDSMDILYETNKVLLPSNIQEGDRLVFLTTGAYTGSTSFVGFNGFPPTPVHYID